MMVDTDVLVMCDHWEQYKINVLANHSVEYKLSMLYMYWTMSAISCEVCSFDDVCRQVSQYLYWMVRQGLIALPEGFKFGLNWDSKITIQEK